MNLKSKTCSFLFVGVIFLMCNACGSSKKKAEQTAGGADLPEFVTESRFVTSLLNGQSALLREDFITAKKAFSACLTLKPNDAEALFRLSQTERKLGNIDVATDLASKACEYNQENIYWYNLYYSELLDIKGDFAKSASVIQEALSKNPKVEFLYAKSDSAWQRVDDYKKAEKVWDLYKVNFPDKNKVAEYNLIGIYEKQNKKSEALSLSKKLFDADPENGNYVSKYFSLIEDKELVKKYLAQYAKGDLIKTEKAFFYENAYFLSFKLGGMDSTLSETTLNLAVNVFAHSEDMSNAFFAHFEELLFSSYSASLCQMGAASKLKAIAQNNTQKAQLQYITAVQLFMENQVAESYLYFEHCEFLKYSSFNFYMMYSHVLLHGGRIRSLEKLTEEAIMAFPMSTQIKYYRAVSLVGKPSFEDWMGETLPFVVDASDKVFFAKMKILHQARIDKKTIGNDFFEGINQLNEISKVLLLQSVLLSGKTNIEKTLFKKFNEGSAFPYSLLFETLWLLNNNQATKAVEMLKNKEESLSTIPLFCRIYALALFESGQIKEAKVWNQKAFDANLDKDLLQHINNGKEF